LQEALGSAQGTDEGRTDSSVKDGSPPNSQFMEIGLNLEAGALRSLPELFALTDLTLFSFSNILYY